MKSRSMIIVARASIEDFGLVPARNRVCRYWGGRRASTGVVVVATLQRLGATPPE
jgi:hypothetical protein